MRDAIVFIMPTLYSSVLTFAVLHIVFAHSEIAPLRMRHLNLSHSESDPGESDINSASRIIILHHWEWDILI